MAKLKGPLFSIEARGTIGDALTFQSVKGINRVGIKNIPTDRRSDSQLKVRLDYAYAITLWQALSANEKASYDALAVETGHKMSGYNYFIQEYFASAFAPPPPTIDCTGGTITHVGGYKIHTFTVNGTLTVLYAGVVELLMVGGGGGGGHDDGGGGGAGGLIYVASQALAIQEYPIVIGQGGIGGNDERGHTGTDTTFNSLSAKGGGGGGGNAAWGGNGYPGGSGGGGGNVGLGGAGTEDQGYDGGAGIHAGGYPGGGGGGAAEFGHVPSPNTVGGFGGNGKQYSISGTPLYYSGGGGGAVYNTGSGGDGGAGGGGKGGNTSIAPVAGSDGLGGGGGGASSSHTGGKGGNGVLIIRYPEPAE